MKTEMNENIKTDANKAVTQLQKMLEECNALKRKLKCMQLLEENSVIDNTKNLSAKSDDLCGLEYKSNSDIFHYVTGNAVKGDLPRSTQEKEEIKFIDRNCAEGESREVNLRSSDAKIESGKLQEKLEDFEKDFRKLQTQYKNTLRGLKNKDLIITELSDKILNANDKNNALQNELSKMAGGEIEFASFQKNLEKQLEKKDWEISELQSKLLKDAQFKSNLLKDIEYYKNELKCKDEGRRKDEDTELSDPYGKYDSIRAENETLCVKLKEMIGINNKTQQKLNEKMAECDNFRGEIDGLKDDLTKAKIRAEILEAERNKILSQHNKVLDNVNSTDKYLLTRESVDIKLRRQNNKLTSENNVYRMENQKLKNLLTVVERTKKELKKQNEQFVQGNGKCVSVELLERANNTLSELQSQNEALQQDLFDTITRTEHLETELDLERTENQRLESDIKTKLAQAEKNTKEMERIKSENNELRGKRRLEICKTTADKNVETKIFIRHVACQNTEILADKNLQTDILYEKIWENCDLIKRKMKNDSSIDAIQHFEENFVREIVFEKSCENWGLQNVGADAPYESLLRKTSSLEEKFEYLENQFLRFNSGKFSDAFFSTRSVRNRGKLGPKFSKEASFRELTENLNGSRYDLQNIESKLNEEQEKLLGALRNLKTTKEKLCREKCHWEL